MKKLFFIVSLLALSLGCLTSCNDSEKPSADYEWDFNVSDIVLHVTSQEGTNLLDAGVAGNILENDIRIEYAGEVYPLQMKPEEVDSRNPMYQPHVCFYRLGTDFLWE